MLVLCVPINMIVAVVYANSGSYIAILPTIVAMICGLATYNKRYQQYDGRE